MDRYFRVEETTYSAGVDEWGDAIPGGPTKPNLRTLKVLKHTPCGVWVDDYGTPRFINSRWNKRFALPSVEEAIVSYRARKSRQIHLAQATIARAHEALRYLDAKGFYTDERKWL